MEVKYNAIYHRKNRNGRIDCTNIVTPIFH